MDTEQFFDRYRELGEEPEDVILNPVIRVNTLKISEKALVKRLTKKGVKLQKIDFLDQGYEVLESEFSLGASVEYLMGYFYIQGAASQVAVQVLDVKEGEVVLDMAASPGGKTTQMAMQMNNTGVIVACDKSRRMERLQNNLERIGITNTICYKKDSRFVRDFNIQFDKILLDAPCSGNFIIDTKWFSKRKITDFKANAQIQKELLDAAFEVLKKGGELVYSTCSLEPEENEMIVDYILEYFDVEIMPIDCIGDPGLVEVFGKKLKKEVEKCRRLWPWKTKTQGFFIAKFKKC